LNNSTQKPKFYKGENGGLTGKYCYKHIKILREGRLNEESKGIY